MYDKFSRVPAERVEAGDICAVCGIADIQVPPDGLWFQMEFIFKVLAC